MKSATTGRLVAVGLTGLGMTAALVERATQVGVGLSSFVFAGLQQRLLSSGLALPGDLRPAVTGIGYDGVGFYALALNPFSTEFIAVADDPGYRQQRILYPIAAWLLARATGQSVLLTLAIVNVLASMAAAWVVAGLAIKWNAHPALGAVAGLSPPMLVGTIHDTAEPLALALMIAGIVAATERRPLATAVLLTAAVMTRETTAVAALSLLLWLMVRFLRDRRANLAMAAAGSIPLVIMAGWQCFLKLEWGSAPILSGGSARLSSVPVLDWLKVVLSPVTVEDPTVSNITQGLWWGGRILLSLAFIGAAVALVRHSLERSLGEVDLLAILFVVAAAPSLLTATATWLETRDYSRTAGEWIVVSVLVMLRTPGPSSNVGLAALVLTSVIAVAL